MDANILTWSVHQFQIFLLIVMRVAFILFMMPLLGASNVPVIVKAGLTLTVSLTLLPVVQIHPSLFPSEPFQFVFFMIVECLIGFILGLTVKMLFAAIQLAGEFVGFQMGLAMAQVVDPQSGVGATLIAQFYYFLALLIFLSVNGHHWFFKALVQSFRLLPPGEIYLREGLFGYVVSLSTKMFVLGIKISAPVMAILILAEVAMGLVAKMVPQINILITSFPITIGLGMIFIGLSLELLVPYLRNLFDETGKEMILGLIPLMAR